MSESGEAFDVIVVGSGVSGGWAAKEFCEKGFKTLLLERGRMVRHRDDYEHEGKGEWEMPHRGAVPQDVIDRDYFISQYAYINEYNQPYLNNDRLNPYDFDGSKRFYWIRASVVGGKSLLWGRWSLRLNPLDFTPSRIDQRGADWPIAYEDLAPWYSYVERFIGVAGSKEGLAQLPDGEFQPPHPLSVAERFMQAQLRKTYPDRRLIHGRVSNMTEDKPEEGRSRCQYRNQCARGCSFGAYFSTQSSTLPAAQKTGNLTLLSDHVVVGLDYDPSTRRVTGVRTINANDKTGKTYRARIVFLNASTIGSLQIMLNSRSETFPNGIANSSGTLGRYVMDKPFRAGAWGSVPGFLDKVEYGRRPDGTFVPRFRNLSGRDADADFVGGYNYYVFGGRGGPSDLSGFGAALKQRMRVPGPWSYGIYGFGECLPYADNMVSLHPTQTDRFGVPLVRFDVTFRENERRMLLDMHREAVAMWRAIGMENIGSSSEVDDQTPGRAIHECGGARMGVNPATSVLNKWSQAHDVANLFVTDGAGFCSSGTVNPSLTYMALTARAADHASGLAKQGAL